MPDDEIVWGDRLAVLVDMQNMYHSAKKIMKGKIQYKQLLADISQGKDIIRAIAYCIQKPNVDQSKFHAALSEFGYDLQVKELQIREGSGPKGSWSVGMAVDAMILADRVDTIVLVTGDSDFIPLVEALKHKGVRVELWAFRESCSQQLIKSVHQFTAIYPELVQPEEKFSKDPHSDTTILDEELVAVGGEEPNGNR